MKFNNSRFVTAAKTCIPALAILCACSCKKPADMGTHAQVSTPGIKETGTTSSVLFTNHGTLAGWDRVYTQQNGTNTEVSSPVYESTTAIRNRQTYQGSGIGNYHAEVVLNTSQLNGTDRYYGQAIYIPADWQFHNQNVTFQQWAPENPAGPWILMFIEGSKLKYNANHNTDGVVEIADISTLRGKWITVVTRINMVASGNFEVWIDGVKKVSKTGNWSTSFAANSSIRWSSGIYCTRWDTDTPTGQTDLSVYHDSFRMATTYVEAQPANHRVVLFQGCNNGGWAAPFEVGSYTMADIIARGGLNDDASSITIPAGLKVTLYQGNNFTGTSTVLTSSNSCLTDIGFNDNVSSLKVSTN